MNNKILRERFLEWYSAAYEPPLIKVAKDVEISRSALCEWKNGNRDFGDTRLERVKTFLEGKI